MPELPLQKADKYQKNPAFCSSPGDSWRTIQAGCISYIYDLLNDYLI